MLGTPRLQDTVRVLSVLFTTSRRYSSLSSLPFGIFILRIASRVMCSRANASAVLPAALSVLDERIPIGLAPQAEVTSHVVIGRLLVDLGAMRKNPTGTTGDFQASLDAALKEYLRGPSRGVRRMGEVSRGSSCTAASYHQGSGGADAVSETDAIAESRALSQCGSVADATGANAVTVSRLCAVLCPQIGNNEARLGEEYLSAMALESQWEERH